MPPKRQKKSEIPGSLDTKAGATVHEQFQRFYVEFRQPIDLAWALDGEGRTRSLLLRPLLLGGEGQCEET
jgi:hypothetical protein